LDATRERVCLQGGLKLDLNAKKGFIKLGANIGERGITLDAFILGRNCRWND
jgi:hypothetical protein